MHADEVLFFFKACIKEAIVLTFHFDRCFDLASKFRKKQINLF